MSQQTSPFLESKFGWNYGESGWHLGMDENLLKTGFMFDGNVDGVVATLPTLVNGQAHFLTTDSRFYFAVGGQWYSSPCPKWFVFKLRSNGNYYQFNGTSAVVVDNFTALDTRLDAAETTIGTLGTAAFVTVDSLATQAELDVASSQANSYSDSVVATHAAAVNPHPQYMTEAESDARYLQITNTQIFGQRTVTNNTTTIAKTAAVDPTLVSNSDYTKITGIWSATPDGITNGVTQGVDNLTIQTTGPYEIKVWTSFTSSVNNTNVAFKFAVNDAITLVRRPRARVGTTGDRVAVAAHGYVSLTAGDVVTLWFASDQTANITLEDAVFSITYLGGFS